jgi:hypothetical protein
VEGLGGLKGLGVLALRGCELRRHLGPDGRLLVRGVELRRPHLRLGGDRLIHDDRLLLVDGLVFLLVDRFVNDVVFFIVLELLLNFIFGFYFFHLPRRLFHARSRRRLFFRLVDSVGGFGRPILTFVSLPFAHLDFLLLIAGLLFSLVVHFDLAPHFVYLHDDLLVGHRIQI